jgi:hypothetical protein
MKYRKIANLTKEHREEFVSKEQYKQLISEYAKGA